jgi:hypothetical protein
MAAEVKKKVRYAYIHKFAAAVALLCFGVIVAAGMMAEARFVTIAFRAFVVTLAISVVSRVIVSILASYEEMNSGKA